MSIRQSRRHWLKRLVLGVGAIAVLPQVAFSQQVVSEAAEPQSVLAPSLLESAEFAYISPEKTNGKESRCHGEVWFAWIDNRIVIVTARDSWKYKALASGLNKAFIWVGDYGRWKGWLGRHNTAFRAGARLIAEASESRDPKLLDRLLVQFSIKYPKEFHDWEQEQRTGYHENRRTLIVYKLTDVHS